MDVGRLGGEAGDGSPQKSWANKASSMLFAGKLEKLGHLRLKMFQLPPPPKKCCPISQWI